MTPYFESENGRLYHGDALDILPHLGQVDLVLTDPPYGTTACSWDTVIPFEPMWEQLKRVIKKNGAIVLFGSQPFTSALVMSNPKMFKYEWVWKKSKPNGWQHAQNQPMKTTENISVFSQSPMGHQSLLGNRRIKYNPQGVKDNGEFEVKDFTHGRTMGARPKQVGKICKSRTGFPSNFLEFPNVIGKKSIHPTQKPVALMEYLIKTYTNEGETVLDFCIGSGPTAVACERLNRKWIGIEIEERYCQIAAKRIEAEIRQRKLF